VDTLSILLALTETQPNVLVNENLEACIADFGHSVTFQATMPTSASQAGTAAYMAPELMDKHGDSSFETGDPNAASDVYALAMLAWEVHMLLFLPGVDTLTASVGRFLLGSSLSEDSRIS
jgi:serine/threonine protein kinase